MTLAIDINDPESIAAFLRLAQKQKAEPGQQPNAAEVTVATEPEQKSAFETRALPLIERNVPVIPLTPRTKKAFMSKWENLATTDRAQIVQWGQDYPEANVASVAKA